MDLTPQLLDTIYTDPRASRRVSAVNAAVDEMIRDGTFSYSALFLAGQPFETLAFMHLDSAEAPTGIPRRTDRDAIKVGPILLVAVTPDGVIRHPLKKWVPVPGKVEQRIDTYQADFGNFAEVEDDFPSRVARMILFRSGWPMRANVGSRTGDLCVEWAWLARAVRTGGDAVHGHGCEALAAEISSRPAFAEFLASKNPAAPATKAKGRSK